MGAKGQDGVAGLPGEKVSLCILICSLTHGKCSWEDRTLVLENELLLPALPCFCSTLKKPLGPIVFSAGALFCLGFFFPRRGDYTELKEATSSSVQLKEIVDFLHIHGSRLIYK